MNRLFVMMTVLLSFVATQAIACGGQEISGEGILALPYVKASRAKLTEVTGQPIRIESIVHSKNHIINLNKDVVASAKCNANYINVYMTTQNPSELICAIVFQVNRQGELDLGGIKSAILCRKSKTAPEELIEVNL